MASFRKYAHGWRAEIFKKGIRESATFPTKREAHDWASKREAEIASLRAGKVIRWTLADVLDRYMADISPTKASGDKEILRLKAVQRDNIGSMVMQDIGPADLAAWRDRRLKSVKPASVLREIGSLRAVWKQAKKGEWGYVDHDPWVEVTKPQESPPRDVIFEDGQVERIVEALGYVGGQPGNKRQEAAVALLLSLETAMRAGEIIGMRWEDVVLEKRIVRLPKTKNGDAREVPLSRRAIELLKSMKGLDKVRVFTLTSALLDAYYRQGRDLAGVQGPTFH